MADNAFERLREGMRAPGGRAVVVLLALLLVIAVWNIGALGLASSNTLPNGENSLTSSVSGGETTVVMYGANGGSGSVENQTVFVDEPAKLSDGSTLVRSGYTLVGWSLSKGDDNEVDFELGGTVKVDKEDEESNVLYAVWVPNES